MFNIYPYINENDLNLDYLLLKLKSVETTLKNFIALNSIKYADPIQWNLTTQYQANTVVIEPNSGTAYISINQSDADYVLWFDSDMTFKPDIVKRLLESIEGKDFISGLYFNRRPPFSPVISTDLKMNKDGFISATPVTSYTKGIMKIRGCGFGCVLMKKQVMRDVKDRFQSMFAMLNNGIVGEDYSFCAKAMMCGYKLYCDTRILLGHMTDTVVSEETYKNFNPKVRDLFKN